LLDWVDFALDIRLGVRLREDRNTNWGNTLLTSSVLSQVFVITSRYIVNFSRNIHVMEFPDPTTAMARPKTSEAIPTHIITTEPTASHASNPASVNMEHALIEAAAGASTNNSEEQGMSKTVWMSSRWRSRLVHHAGVLNRAFSLMFGEVLVFVLEDYTTVIVFIIFDGLFNPHDPYDQALMATTLASAMMCVVALLTLVAGYATFTLCEECSRKHGRGICSRSCFWFDFGLKWILGGPTIIFFAFLFVAWPVYLAVQYVLLDKDIDDAGRFLMFFFWGMCWFGAVLFAWMISYDVCCLACVRGVTPTPTPQARAEGSD
jgi:hypothetical protein